MSRPIHVGAVWRCVTGLLLAVSLVTSCFPVPPHWTAESRHNVTPATAKELRVGVTTLQDVVLDLGEPDSVSDDGLRLGYQWTRVRWIAVVSNGLYGTAQELGRTTFLELTFDEQGRLSRREMVSKWSE